METLISKIESTIKVTIAGYIIPSLTCSFLIDGMVNVFAGLQALIDIY